jgi:hypothetical protein
LLRRAGESVPPADPRRAAVAVTTIAATSTQESWHRERFVAG